MRVHFGGSVMEVLLLLLISLIAIVVSLVAVAAMGEWLTRRHLPPQAKTLPHPPKPANDNLHLVRAVMARRLAAQASCASTGM
jgi:uncharacterized protein YneF (UPF0154 family)